MMRLAFGAAPIAALLLLLALLGLLRFATN
jgi:hypothetical protein